MKNLSPSSMAILKRVEALSGRPIEFRPDSTGADFAAEYKAALEMQSEPPKTPGA